MPQTLPTVQDATPTPSVDLTSSAGLEYRAQSALFGDLANSAAELRQQLQPVLDQQAEARALESVDQAFAQRPEGDTSLPDLTLRTAWTRQDQVYNNAVTAGAMARAGIDAEAEATRLREQFSYDPAGFESAYTQFVDGYVENAPPQIGQQIELDMLQTFSREQARIAERTRVAAVGEQEEALTTRMAHLDAQMRSGITQDGIGFVDSEEGSRLAAQYADIVNILVDNPAFGHSAEWGADQLDTFSTRARESVLIEGVRGIYTDEGPIAALEFVDEQVRSMDLSSEEAIGVRSRLMGEINSLTNIDSARRSARREQDEMAHEQVVALGRDFLARGLEQRSVGQPLSEEWLSQVPDMVRIGAITESQARQYMDASTSAVPENDQLVVSYENLARTGNMSDEQLREALNPLLGRGINADSYRRILDVRSQYDDERLQAGTAVVTAAFGQAAFDFAFDNSQAVLEQEAISELDGWLEDNPEATRFEARRQATLISIRLGRSIGAPPVSRRGAPDVSATEDTFQGWWNDWLDYDIRQTDTGGWGSEAEATAQRESMRNYRDWWQYQNSLTQMERNLNNAQ